MTEYVKADPISFGACPPMGGCKLRGPSNPKQPHVHPSSLGVLLLITNDRPAPSHTVSQQDSVRPHMFSSSYLSSRCPSGTLWKNGNPCYVLTDSLSKSNQGSCVFTYLQESIAHLCGLLGAARPAAAPTIESDMHKQHD
jgi:hypothetical protein